MNLVLEKLSAKIDQENRDLVHVCLLYTSDAADE